MPKSLLGVLIDLVLTWGVLQTASMVLGRAGDVLDPRAAVMLVVFPALVVAFAMAGWVIMFFQALLRPHH